MTRVATKLGDFGITTTLGNRDFAKLGNFDNIIFQCPYLKDEIFIYKVWNGEFIYDCFVFYECMSID